MNVNSRRRFLTRTGGLVGILASGIPPAEAIYIGDEVRDAEASRKAGMAFGAVAWGHHDERILRAQKPEAFFNTAEEIVAALR